MASSDKASFPPRLLRLGCEGSNCDCADACRWATAAIACLRPRRDGLRGWRLVGDQLIAQCGCLAPQRTLHLAAYLLLVLLHALLDVLRTVLEHPIDQAGQLVSRRGHRTFAANPTFDPAVEQAQRRLRPPQCLRRHPQGERHPVLPPTRAVFLLRLVALVLPRADA